MATNISPPLPPPPLLPPPHGFHVPVIAIALIGIIATGILLISYYIFVIKCCLNLHRVDVLNRLLSRRRHLDPETTSATTATSSPAAKGLDEAVIRSIPVIKYRKSSDRRHKLFEEANNPEIECAVCLSEFEEGEKLRVIPNCCHAFHIDCIDVWLQNSANCPLCRSSISASSVLYNPDIIKNFNRSRSRNSDDSFSGDDNDYVVIEIQGNNLNQPRLINPTNSLLDEEGRSVMEKENKVLSSGRRHVCSMGDELIDSMMRKKDDEFRVEPIRRSISMDLSSIYNREFRLEIEECCKGEATSNNNKNNNNMEEVIRSGSSHSSSSSNSKVRRSIFSFGYGRSSKGSLIQRVQLDP